MTTRERAHQIVDLLDESALEDALEYLEWLTSEKPETLSESELADLEQARREMAAGEYVAWEDLKRELNL